MDLTLKNLLIGKCNNLIDKDKRRQLNDESIKLIREIYVSGDRDFGIRALARKFNVSPSAIAYYVHDIKL